MLTVAVLAVLMAGDTPAAQQPHSLPAGQVSEISRPSAASSSATPLAVEVSAGWVSTRQSDPYGRTGVTRFTVTAPLVGARLRGQSWYADFATQMAYTSLANRNTTASVGRDIASIGPVRWGLNIEFADVRFRHDDFRSGDVTVATNRTATIGLVGLSFGIGPYRGTSVRLAALGGYYKNRYGSVVELPGFAGDEPLADDELPVYGARLAVDGISLLNRVEFGGSVRYLQLSGKHAPSLPDREYSGSCSLNIRLFSFRKKQLFIGGLARFGPARPSLITDKTFGLRGIWKFR